MNRKSFQPHHRSSEVYSGLSKNKTVPGTIQDEFDVDNAHNVEIMMVRPMTIEDAIRRMQKVPSVEFACSKMIKNRHAHETNNKDDNEFDNKKQLQVKQNEFKPTFYEPNIDPKSFKHHTTEVHHYSREYSRLNLQQISVPEPPKRHHNQEYYFQNSRIFDGKNIYNDETIIFDNQSSQIDDNSIVLKCESSILSDKTIQSFQTANFLPQTIQVHPQEHNFHFIDDSEQESYCEDRKLPVQRLLFPVPEKQTSEIQTPEVKLNNQNYDTEIVKPTDKSDKVESDLKRNVSFRSYRSISTQRPINDQPLIRRQTMVRLGSDIDHSLYYFTPKESWLTSLYVKLPKSKSFSRIQLEMLNLPCFGSVGRFLEETATSADHRSWFESKSFLLNMFNQFVPHNKIPLNTLSKYVEKLKKYKILSTIEFNFLRVPSLDRQLKRYSLRLPSRNSITSNTSNNSPGKNNPRTCGSSRRRYAISGMSSTSQKCANKLENLIKNANQRAVPFDYNRVVLRRNDEDNDGNHEHEDDHTDYINASHIDSLLKPNAYIAAQGPRDCTLTDWWLMIWQQNVGVIVMLTKVYEFIRVMCSQYWPVEVDQAEVYDDHFEVILVSEDKLADYVVRTLKVRNLKKSTSSKSSKSVEKSADNVTDKYPESEYRTIYQLHFLSWKANACPFSDSILKFRRRVQIYEKKSRESFGKSYGPLLVHCSNGCGRSGTYICLDANLQLAEEEGVVDVFNYAKSLRKSRVDMIENLEQYRFIYETIEEYHTCGVTWFHFSEISQQMKTKSAKNKITKQNEYQAEFERLLNMTSSFTIGDCAGGHRLENRDKNRDVSIVPPDNFRPYLTSFQTNEQTDYINAVFVDGYSRPKEYIVTEWPLKKTIADIWSLIYDHDCNTVVVLGGIPPNKSRHFPQFWPRDASKSVKYGPIFTVETISMNEIARINTWILRVNKKVTSLTELMAGIKAEPKITQVFEFNAWPFNFHVPRSTNSLVELIHMVERWRQRTGYGPVLVVSANGKSRVGVYCAANFAIEQVVAHEEIDIFNAVKTVRRHRSALIETIMEYKYCYDLTLHYVSHYMNNGNYNQIFRRCNI